MTAICVILVALSLISIVLGLIKPSLVIRWGDPDKRTRGKVLKTYLIAFVVFFGLGMAVDRMPSSDDEKPATTSSQQASSSSSSSSSVSSGAATKKESEPKWNKSEPEAEKNGNANIAIKELKKVGDMKPVAEQVDPAELMKRPWDYYGKVVSYSGRISDIGDNPPGSPESKAFGGDTYTVVVMGDGDSSVQAIMSGKSGSLQKDQQVTIYGFPVGTMKLQNRMGGQNNAVLLIGK